MTDTQPSVRLQLAYIYDFPTVAGLLRDTGARRIDSRLFVLDQPMTPSQVLALVQLLQFDRKAKTPAITLETAPRLSTTAYWDREEETLAWWGTVDEKLWLAEQQPPAEPAL
ncbi:hypothetical protein [Streptomyces sp. NPDC046371]|uniref:hypothetical protein n=1 Tax=Streptomyces sp. NPDC046371 TaxID=3154916 RepID=UPI0033F78767